MTFVAGVFIDSLRPSGDVWPTFIINDAARGASHVQGYAVLHSDEGVMRHSGIAAEQKDRSTIVANVGREAKCTLRQR